MKLLRLLWDRLSLYLPVILMGVLALGAYWLVRSTPKLIAPAPAAPLSHEPDYFMRQFSVKTFDATGRLKSEVSGRQARHFPDTDTLEIDEVRIRSFNAQGQLTTASATRALTNSDASEVQLFGKAEVVRTEQADAQGATKPRLMFKSEFLHAFMKTERVISNQPVELTRGQDRFTADAMDFDNPSSTMQLSGRVKGILEPASRQ